MAAPVLASTGGSDQALSHATRSYRLAQPGLPAANAVSHTFAGWAFGKTGATSVVSTFQIPTKRWPCATNEFSGISPGSFMITGTTATPKFNGATVQLGCAPPSPSSPFAQAAVYVNGTGFPAPFTISLGDKLTATVTTTTGTGAKTTATIKDLTHPATFTKSGTGAPALQELVIDDSMVNSSNNKQLPVVRFGTIPFSAGTVGGKPLGSVTPQSAYDMKTTTNVLQISTGSLTGIKKDAFTTTFKHQ